jgi:hypothetical protein
VQDLAVRRLLADRANVLAQRPVRHGHGVLEVGVEAPDERREVIAVEFEPEALGFLDDPVQGFIGEAIGRVAAADIAVDAGKPGLLQCAGPAGWTRPEVGLERLAALVDGERVKAFWIFGFNPTSWY